MAFGPAGTLAVGYRHTGPNGIGGGVVLFDAKGERLCRTPMEVRQGGVLSVAFGSGGTLAAGCERSGVELFDADPASWRRKAERVSNRNFTRREWAEFFPDQPYRRTIRSRPWPHNLPDVERKKAEAQENEPSTIRDAS